jgi:hypothetical protein
MNTKTEQEIQVIEFPEYKTHFGTSMFFNSPPGDGWVHIKTMTQNHEKTWLEEYNDHAYFSKETKMIVDQMLSIIGQDEIDRLITEATDLCGDKSVIQDFKFLLIIRKYTYDKVFEIISSLPYEKQYKNLVYAIVQYQVGRAVHDYSGD